MAAELAEMHDDMPVRVKDLQHQALPQDTPTDSELKPVVVGLYGISGCGKTYLLSQLKQELGQERFAFYEGSETIASVVPGGLAKFQTLSDKDKAKYRELAIDKIRQECVDTRRAGVVTGHFKVWNDKTKVWQQVFTEKDRKIYSHILYLDVPAELIHERRLHDTKRGRPLTQVHDLSEWQVDEKNKLRGICRKHRILFSLVSSQRTLNKVRAMLLDFQIHTEEYNLAQAERKLDEAVTTAKSPLKTMLVMDADRTVAAEDTGTLFWNRISSSRFPEDVANTLRTLFSSPEWQYSYGAFRQATLLYEEATKDVNFDQICDEIASDVNIHPEFLTVFQKVAQHEHVSAVIVTCGLRRIWEKVIENAGLSETVKVIGGGRIADGFVVTPKTKAALVSRLQTVHQIYVWAFGDSPMDLDMLHKADEAIVVVGEKDTRSRTMDDDLGNAIRDGSLQARQALLPSSAPPRLNIAALPIVQLTDVKFIDSILSHHTHRTQNVGLAFYHATNRSAAKLLMTPMRDARVWGPALQKVHHHVGRYLATEFLTNVIGLETYQTPHVQGHQTTGHRLLDENQTLIVPLMRGGEPMAQGVNDVFPLAMFLHAKDPEDVNLHHLQSCKTIILVDAVINSGVTMAKFVQHIRRLNSTCRIVLVAGVVQAESIHTGSPLHGLGSQGKIALIALRHSDNKYTGQGTTDTGNRLFNTTHLP